MAIILTNRFPQWRRTPRALLLLLSICFSQLLEVSYPERRFVEWSQLSGSERRSTSVLGYFSFTWNVPGTASIEGWSWYALTDFELEAAMSLGFDEESWDCYQNHYEGYWWDELVSWGLDVPYLTLGWTEASWDGYGVEPDSWLKSWDELTETEQNAALDVCYQPQTWDQVALDEWDLYGQTSSPSKSPTTSSPTTSSPTTPIPSEVPSAVPSAVPSVAPSTVTMIPSNSSSLELEDEV